MSRRSEKKEAAEEHNEIQQWVEEFFDSDGQDLMPSVRNQIVIAEGLIETYKNTMASLKLQMEAARASKSTQKEEQLFKSATEVVTEIRAIEAQLERLRDAEEKGKDDE